jgi:glyoxylase-like metal-dependent hydrolase (beta-lactamase superfamily II)
MVWDESTGEAALFDTEWEEKPTLELVQKHHLVVRHLFLTHHHPDHVSALGLLQKRFPTMQIHSSNKSQPPSNRNRPGGRYTVGGLSIEFRATPGHSDDGASYVIEGFPGQEAPAIIVGDCIFAGSMGRGFYSDTLLRQSIMEQIFTLPQETLICPGHGPATTLAEEKQHNPFFT